MYLNVLLTLSHVSLSLRTSIYVHTKSLQSRSAVCRDRGRGDRGSRCVAIEDRGVAAIEDRGVSRSRIAVCHD